MFSRPDLGAAISLVLTASLVTPGVAQVVVGQTDTFQNGTTQNWTGGAGNPNPPLNVSTGGPAGTGDAFLEIRSNGGAGAGSKLVAFNQQQWAGTYSPAVTHLGMDLENLGTAPLTIRLAFQDVNSNQYSSTTPVSLPASPGWLHAIFDLSDSSMTQVAGAPQPFGAALANGITEIRILDAVAPAFIGDTIAATLGVDNITALSAVPEPGTLALVGVAAFGLFARLRRGGSR
jgi:hypothetical protein